MLRTAQALLLCAAMSLIATAQVGAGIVTLTGADLNTDPNASFPGTRSRTVVGSSLDIGTATGDLEVLLIYDLLPAGTFSGLSPTADFTVNLNLTRVTLDHDIWYGLWDGTNVLGVTSWDGDRSSRYFGMTSDGSTAFLGGSLGTTSYSAAIPVGESFDIGGEYSLSAAGPSFHAVFPDGSDGPTVSTATFDRTAAISLLVLMGSPSEQTSINSLTIEGPFIGSAVVPEPSSLALLCLGACITAARATRRSRI